MCPREFSNYVIITMFICSKLNGLLLIVFLRFITQDDTYWIYYNVALQAIVLAVFCFLPESPEFYYAKGRYAECKEVLARIARVNGIAVKPERFQFSSE